MFTTEELKKMKPTEVNEELQKSSLELFKQRLAVTTRQSNDSSKIKALRHYIARIKSLTK